MLFRGAAYLLELVHAHAPAWHAHGCGILFKVLGDGLGLPRLGAVEQEEVTHLQGSVSGHAAVRPRRPPSLPCAADGLAVVRLRHDLGETPALANRSLATRHGSRVLLSADGSAALAACGGGLKRRGTESKGRHGSDGRWGRWLAKWAGMRRLPPMPSRQRGGEGRHVARNRSNMSRICSQVQDHAMAGLL